MLPPVFTRSLLRWALLYGLAVPLVAHAQATAEPLPHRQDTTASFALPFKLVGGLIVLQQLSLNGQRGDFILDTGNAAALLVERTAFTGQLRTSPRHLTGHGSTGTVAIQELPVTSFQLGAARYTGFTAHALSLAAIRAYVGGHLLGVIGYGLLREYEVVIDYPHRRVSFYSLRAGAPPARPFVRQDSLAFVLVGGAPIANGYLGTVPVALLLDTGAAANQLDEVLCRTLAPDARPVLVDTEHNTGVDGHRQLTQRGTLPSLVLGPTTWKALPVQVTTLYQPISGRALAYQGILGYPFLSQDGLVSFHYGRQQFYSLTPVHP
ncbi:MAG: retropepsin-like aspartic protease [Janthinobacterium lividum]